MPCPGTSGTPEQANGWDDGTILSFKDLMFEVLFQKVLYRAERKVLVKLYRARDTGGKST